MEAKKAQDKLEKNKKIQDDKLERFDKIKEQKSAAEKEIE